MHRVSLAVLSISQLHNDLKNPLDVCCEWKRIVSAFWDAAFGAVCCMNSRLHASTCKQSLFRPWRLIRRARALDSLSTPSWGMSHAWSSTSCAYTSRFQDSALYRCNGWSGLHEPSDPARPCTAWLTTLLQKDAVHPQHLPSHICAAPHPALMIYWPSPGHALS